MSITFECPQCRQRYKVSDEWADKKCICRSCQASIFIPRSEPIAPPVESLARLPDPAGAQAEGDVTLLPVNAPAPPSGSPLNSARHLPPRSPPYPGPDVLKAGRELVKKWLQSVQINYEHRSSARMIVSGGVLLIFGFCQYMYSDGLAILLTKLEFLGQLPDRDAELEQVLWRGAMFRFMGIIFGGCGLIMMALGLKKE